MEIYKAIGLMSGTSLDGLDIAYCIFEYNHAWKYQIVHAQTLSYPQDLSQKLRNAPTLSGFDLVELHTDFGRFCGLAVKDFIQKHQISVDLVASHGHTVFHQPHKNISFQIGNGALMAALCQTPLICDFRSTDVAFGGQGAPLVPIGDKLLFANYDYCLNLGGIANISFEENQNRLAYDVCFVNIVLNELAQKMGYEYDKDGNIAKNASKNMQLFEKLNNLPYFAQKAPKSLGREYAQEHIFPLLEQSQLSLAEQLCTFTHHAAFQIGVCFDSHAKILATGGGAFNRYLIELIQHQCPQSQIIVADHELVNYKEALIFAFLGVLRWKQQANALASVTGASQDSCGGALYLY